jgi:aspartate kinase
MKFGGTSVKNDAAMENVIEIVKSAVRRNPVVVLSASSGITDKLLKLVISAPKKPFNKLLPEIREIGVHHIRISHELIRHENIKKDCIEKIQNLVQQLETLIEGVTLLKECTPRSQDAAASFGELLSTTVFESACRSQGIESVFADARLIMMTDSCFMQAKVDFDATKQNTKKLISPDLDKNKIIITQGFIGSDGNGVTTTLGRGGSDYSAAVFGSVLGAEEIQIWTDVSGILTADPRLVQNAKTIPQMGFEAVRELSFFGAKVLHPDTIKPAIESRIPVRVLNTYKPNEPGTIIFNKAADDSPKLLSVHLKKNCLQVSVALPHDKNPQLVMQEILKKSAESDVPIVSVSYFDANAQILIDGTHPVEQVIKNILYEYQHRINPVALLCICGTNLNGSDLNNCSVLEGLALVLSPYSPNGLLYGVSTSSVVASVPTVKEEEALVAVHELILKSM